MSCASGRCLGDAMTGVHFRLLAGGLIKQNGLLTPPGFCLRSALATSISATKTQSENESKRRDDTEEDAGNG